MKKYLTEEKFDEWREHDFKPVQDACHDASKNIEDMDEKIDSLVDNAWHWRSRSARVEGAVWVMIPLMILSISLVVHIMRNGVS